MEPSPVWNLTRRQLPVVSNWALGSSSPSATSIPGERCDLRTSSLKPRDWVGPVLWLKGQESTRVRRRGFEMNSDI